MRAKILYMGAYDAEGVARFPRYRRNSLDKTRTNPLSIPRGDRIDMVTGQRLAVRRDARPHEVCSVTGRESYRAPKALPMRSRACDEWQSASSKFLGRLWRHVSRNAAIVWKSITWGATSGPRSEE